MRATETPEEPHLPLLGGCPEAYQELVSACTYPTRQSRCADIVDAPWVPSNWGGISSCCWPVEGPVSVACSVLPPGVTLQGLLHDPSTCACRFTPAGRLLQPWCGGSKRCCSMDEGNEWRSLCQHSTTHQNSVHAHATALPLCWARSSEPHAQINCSVPLLNANTLPNA